MEPLRGGNSNQVLKDGQTVLRNTGTWSPFVHQLLQYLTEAGFTESPIFLGLDDNKERLSFIDGEVGNYPLKPFMQSTEILVEAATLLRRFHDLTQHFPIAPDMVFQLPVHPKLHHEVICHNDFAPYNCVFRDGHLVGIIDFDTAAPGSRLWDIAYAVYRFAPLVTDTHCLNMGWQEIPDRAARLKLFCDVYGLEERDRLIGMVKQRLEALIDYMTKTASNLEHLPIYRADLQYLSENENVFTGAINRDLPFSSC